MTNETNLNAESTFTKLEFVSFDVHEDRLNEWLQSNEGLNYLLNTIGYEGNKSQVKPLNSPAGWHQIPAGGRADVLAVDEETGRRFIIESQKGTTNDDHLLKCLYYAANFPDDNQTESQKAASKNGSLGTHFNTKNTNEEHEETRKICGKISSIIRFYGKFVYFLEETFVFLRVLFVIFVLKRIYKRVRGNTKPCPDRGCP